MVLAASDTRSQNRVRSKNATFLWRPATFREQLALLEGVGKVVKVIKSINMIKTVMVYTRPVPCLPRQQR